MTSKVFGNGVDGVHYDIVLYLVDSMPDEALANFSQACKSIYNLAKSKLITRKLSSINMAHLIDPLHMVDETAKSDGALDIVKIITFEEWMRTDRWMRTYNPFRTDAEGKLQRCSNEIATYLLDRVHCLPVLPDLEKEKLARTIKLDGFFTVAGMLVLLMLCPNVEEMRYQGDMGNLLTTIHVTIASIHAERLLPSKVQTSNLPFLKLKKITLSSCNLSTDRAAECLSFKCTIISPEYLLNLASIPSLRQLALSQILIAPGIRGIDDTVVRKLVPSNVEKVLLERCSITPWTLNFLVEHLSRLKCFQLSCYKSDWLVRKHISMAYTDFAAASETWLSESTKDILGFDDIDNEEQRTFVRGLKHVTAPVLEAKNLSITCSKGSPPLVMRPCVRNQQHSTVFITTSPP